MTPSVLHVAQPTDGGVPRCVADLAMHQVTAGWDVSVACPRSGPLVTWIAEAGARHLTWEAARAPGSDALGEAKRLSAIMRELAPDILHLHSSKAGLAGRLVARGRRRTVFQPHCWSFEAAGALRRPAVAWERVASRWTHLIICVSQAERATGARAGIRGRYEVVPNGVDLARWPASSAEEQGATRRALGLSPGPLVVCVGRVCRQKGQDVLLDAWPLVLRALPDAQLVLVGDGPDESSLRRRDVPRTRLVGRREDVAAWLAAADVVVLPSRWEGMALTLLEAMARGRTVVATDVAGTRECLGDEAGGIVPSEDPAALARALLERVTNPALAAAEGTAARRRVERGFSLERTTARILELYGDLLFDTGP